MSDVIICLAERRLRASSSPPLEHPAGVAMPFDAALITPEVRGQIRSGAYSADIVRRLPDAVIPGDRVLVIGGGLGVVSTLVAGVEGVNRVIAAEPNAALFRYIDHVHDLNGVSGVETINGVLAVGKRGDVPFLTECDPRTSPLMPHSQSRPKVTMVPLIDLNLILAEERISLIICDTPTAPAQLLAQADLGQVDRILMSHGDNATQYWDGDGVCTQLVARGYSPEPSGTAILLRRFITWRNGSTRIATPARLDSAPGLANLG